MFVAKGLASGGSGSPGSDCSNPWKDSKRERMKRTDVLESKIV